LKSRYYNNFIPTLGIRSVSTKLPKYRNKNDSMKLKNIHEMVHSLDDIDIMVNNELDRNKTIEVVNENYLVYVIVGLLISTLVLIILMYVIYRFKCNIITGYTQPVKETEIKIGFMK